jgi:hypothetical protein
MNFLILLVDEGCSGVSRDYLKKVVDNDSLIVSQTITRLNSKRLPPYLYETTFPAHQFVRREIVIQRPFTKIAF